MTKDEAIKTALEELKFRACQFSAISEWKETKANLGVDELLEKMHEEQLQRLQWAAAAYFKAVITEERPTEAVPF